MPAPQDFEKMIRDLKAQVVRNGQRKPFANSGLQPLDPGQLIQDGSITIPDNGLLLVDGGDVVMLNEDLVEVFRLGVGAFGDRSLTVRRGDDTVALQIADVLGDGVQHLRLYDRSGTLIAGDSILSPSGFDAPHMAILFIPTDYTSSATAQSTSSATFAATHEHRGFKQNPALKLQVMAMCSDATTAAEVQVWSVLDSAYLGGFLASPPVHTIAVPAATTAFTLFEFSSPLATPGGMSSDMHLEIHARVTAGTGSVSVAPIRSVGSGF